MIRFGTYKAAVYAEEMDRIIDKNVEFQDKINDEGKWEEFKTFLLQGDGLEDAGFSDEEQQELLDITQESNSLDEYLQRTFDFFDIDNWQDMLAKFFGEQSVNSIKNS